LGNGEVSLLELVVAYSMLARGGIYRDPKFFLSHSPRLSREKRIFSPEVCSLIANILSDPYARALEFDDHWQPCFLPLCWGPSKRRFWVKIIGMLTRRSRLSDTYTTPPCQLFLLEILSLNCYTFLGEATPPVCRRAISLKLKSGRRYIRCLPITGENWILSLASLKGWTWW